MSKYTPGPWTVDPPTIRSLRHSIQASRARLIIAHIDDVEGFTNGCGSTAANARLIVAAPDLYEACKRVDAIVKTLPEEA